MRWDPMRCRAVFFDDFRAAGGEVRRFNPLHPWRIAYRNHRKLLVCDHQAAIVGGFNIGDEYAGDGADLRLV